MNEAEQLQLDGIINDDELSKIQAYEANKLFSIHWELRTILYLGILLLTSGIGILVYLNIDTIGHQTILAAIAIACGACIYYTYKNKQPYSNGLIKNISPLFDYIALLGCLLFGTFIGYMRFEYQLFGSQVWMATLLPAVLFIYCAYIFDHKGLLALGITAVASTIGLSIAPMQLLDGYDFFSLRILFMALVFGALLIAFAKYSDVKQIKTHFSFSYHNFAVNLLFVACLALLFHHPFKIFSFLLLVAIGFYFIKYAIAQQSFLFLLLSTIYGYIGITYVVFSFLFGGSGDTAFIFGVFYILASCVGVILFFIKYKKILRIK